MPINVHDTGPMLNTNNTKICHHCHEPIIQDLANGKGALKALDRYYHEHCFICYDCNTILKPKFFPYQLNPNEDVILLCQFHYFKRHDLLCKVCDKPLRGLYYTAFGDKYDEEHFSCTICHVPCGIKKCFMFDDKLYCKYHFLRHFSKNCKGCNYPISDRYIEFPKGNEIHCWHPECYGIHKYWYVNLSAETLGLPTLPILQYNPSNPISDVNPTPAELDKQLKAFDYILNKTWTVLYRFEEEAASCISDMFQYLSSSDQIKGIDATALFVLKIECLFKGLDHFAIFNESLNIVNQGVLNFNNSKANCNTIDYINTLDNNSNELSNKYKSLTRNLTTKIMIYLQLLRKLSTKDSNTIVVSSFMSVITGLAHFLKLILRYGFHTSLEQNRLSHSSQKLISFLGEVEQGEFFEKDPFHHINIPITATDNCLNCSKYIQEECIKFQENRWHFECFECFNCKSYIKLNDINEATCNKEKKIILCSSCSMDDPNSISGFKIVTRLQQLIYLCKIALIRSRAVMLIYLKKKPMDRNQNDSITIQQSYIRTLNDIKRLRSRRENVRIAHNKDEARKSIVLNTAEEDLGGSFQKKDSLGLVIETENMSSDHDLGHHNNSNNNNHENDKEKAFNNAKILTLDDISRIVAAEQARELRPNAFIHFKNLKEEESDLSSQKRSGKYYSELDEKSLYIVWVISSTLLMNEGLLKESNLKDMIPNFENKDKSNSQSKFWNQMKNAMGMKSKKPNTPTSTVLGKPLEELTDKYGILSDLGIGPEKIKIPIILNELISSLRQMDMSVEGIFRKNGNIRRLRELTEAINENPLDMPDLSSENAIQLSALLKKFIRELPDPLLTTKLYDLWMQSVKFEDNIKSEKIISLIYSLLPKYNRNSLEVLLSFLNWTATFSYIENKMGSKMDIHNLSTVIAPNILYMPEYESSNVDVENKPQVAYSSDYAQNKGQYHFLAIELIDFLIKHNEEMAIVPNFLYQLLVKIQELNLTDIDKIKEFVLTQVNNIDYSEFNRANSMKMKTSSIYFEQKKYTIDK